MYFSIKEYLYANFSTFNYVEYNGNSFFAGAASGKQNNFTFSGMSNGLPRVVSGNQLDTDNIGSNLGMYACAANSLCFGDGQLEITGLATPQSPTLSTSGTAGAAQYTISIIAKDSAGRRTMRSASSTIATANATLTGSNYLSVGWLAVPGAASYDVLQTDPGNASQFRVIATSASAGVNLTSNPAGAFTYTNPTYNETTAIKTRGQSADVITITFTDADTTPSVAAANQFTASNTGATTITNFDDGVSGQTIVILFTNANSTLQHNATIKMRSGGNLTPAANTVYRFTLRSGVWYEN